jgi:hypothetical protein
MIYKHSINPITNPNPVSSHQHVTIHTCNIFRELRFRILQGQNTKAVIGPNWRKNSLVFYILNVIKACNFRTEVYIILNL